MTAYACDPWGFGGPEGVEGDGGGSRRMQVTGVEEEDRERVLCKEKEAVGRL